jgi:hypothetical protein
MSTAIPIFTRFILVAGVVCLVELLPHSLAQETDSSKQTELLETLVAKLSSDKFSVREDATEQLALQFDDSMLPQMDAIAKTLTDLEARIRLAGVISKIRYERLQNQIRSFVRSRDPNETFGFEGWKTFSRYSGENRSSKMLFLKLLDRYPELVEKALESKQAAVERTKLIAARLGENRSQLRYSEIEDGLALLYCINASEELYDLRLERISLSTFMVAPFGPFLSEPQFRTPLERLLFNWAVKVKDEKQGCLALFMEKNMPHARELALGILESSTADEDPDTYLLAMHALYRFGQREDLPKVEKWLDTKVVCFERERQNVARERYTIEYRDVALLIAFRLAGEDPSDDFRQLRLHENQGFQNESILEPAIETQFRTDRVEKWRNKRKNEKQTGA